MFGIPGSGLSQKVRVNARKQFTIMTVTTHSARITGPLTYAKADSAKANIPIGACLVEQISGGLVNIVYGATGQSSAALPVEDVEAAAKQGHLVLLG